MAAKHRFWIRSQLKAMHNKIKTINYILAFFVIFFISWTYYTEIEEVASGSGKIIPSGKIQTLQNLEGGIVKKILVTEGEYVTEGQTLVELSDAVAESQTAGLSEQMLFVRAKIVRLNAEITGSELIFPDELEKNAGKFVIDQRRIYNSRKENMDAEKNKIESIIKQRKNEIIELNQKKKFVSNSIVLTKNQIDFITPLYERGNYSKVEFLKLKKELNSLLSDFDNISSTLPRIDASIEEAEFSLNEISANHFSEVSEEISEANNLLTTMQQKSAAVSDRLRRMQLASPVDGLVKQIYVNTIGAVISPTAPIVDIVPTDQRLVVETKISPADIGFIMLNQKANISLTAYDPAIFGYLEGQVKNIGADSFLDEDGTVFFPVRIEILQDQRNEKLRSLDILPGMVADVRIVTGKKSIFAYLSKPITKTLNNSLTER